VSAGNALLLANNAVLSTGSGNVSLSAGAGGIAETTGAEIASTGTVTLNTSGAIGTAALRLEFDAVYSPVGVVIGTTLQPSSAYLDGMGSLTLGNIIGTSVNTTLDVTARKGLIVAPGALIATGTGTISLAADVNANGTGDGDTTDALAIQSGATVTSFNPGSSAITLRGAAVNIDTSSDPAQVGGNPTQLSSTPTATLTGLNGPASLAFDSHGNLFVPNESGTTVSEFAPGSTTPTATLTGLSFPRALAFDSKGDLFVGDYEGTTVLEFAPGGTTPIATLTGLSRPAALVFDKSGNLFVANYNGTTVSEFAPGSTTPTATLTGLNQPRALALDSSGNLFVANRGGTTVSEFAPGSTTPTATLTGLNLPLALAFDSHGNLFVANVGGTTVSEFAPGSTTPTATLTGLNAPDSLAFDRSGVLFVSNRVSYNGTTVSEFAPGSTVPTATLTGLNDPEGLAFDGSGNLFVTNSADNSGTTVSEFAHNASAGGVVIRTALSAQTMSIGGSASGANINLTNAELARIYTTATGTITFGDSTQTGTITFQDATPATTAGASLVVRQAATGLGQIVLNAGSGVALSVGSGNVTLSAGKNGITASFANSTADIATTGLATLNTSGVIGSSGDPLQFDAVEVPSSVVVGSTQHPSGIYLTGLGSLTLGKITGANATLSVIAKTGLTLAAKAVLSTGNGPITLSAGSGGIAAGAGSDIATTNVLTLNTTGAIGSASRLLVLDGQSTPSSVVIGSTGKPKGIYLEGQGNVNLGAVTSKGPQYYRSLGGSIIVSAQLTTTNSTITFASPVVLTTTVNMVVGMGSVRMLSTSSLGSQINGTTTSTYTQLNVTGSVNLDADNGLGALLNVAVGYDSQVGDTYTLIQTTAGVQGTFQGLAEGATITIGGKVYQISYAANGGKAVTLTRIS
jgi:hypothetical protein